ncbi:7651_t:CDS:2 [Entrophospora sp. SA101]|nr:7651_t:CDS:2 [Entrophospora sp. SA101]CAJ0841965.1 1116_t:CDS:2 [Entrophospora sp. SA101]CAJ0844160.1 2830_t:CDS:2 [Entrophospora sp. SA101]CAJ0922508.1 14653_t:CDS:2 [Entrophospora sp. SA101]
MGSIIISTVLVKSVTKNNDITIGQLLFRTSDEEFQIVISQMIYLIYLDLNYDKSKEKYESLPNSVPYAIFNDEVHDTDKKLEEDED